MNRKKSLGNEYIEHFPKFRKWINECACCHRQGYNPDMPERISACEFSMGSYFIKKYFSPLSLDENGLCEVCAKLNKNKIDK